MYDQSFNQNSILRVLRKSDFNDHPALRQEPIKDEMVLRSIERARIGKWNVCPLSVNVLRKKPVYAFTNFYDELLIRKINNNIRQYCDFRHPARTSIISNVANIVSEGVNYILYRLDVKSFYESFDINDVLKKVTSIPQLSGPSKALVINLFEHFRAMGGTGIPRGLAVSATLSELMMKDFDESIRKNKNIFFYSRYVDDIIIITNATEDPPNFIKNINLKLPNGLSLSRNKEFFKLVDKVKGDSASVLDFEYLGYKFSVINPAQKNCFRDVILDIADSKVAKLKTRIIRALIGYCQDLDFDLFERRLKFLAGNFSIMDSNLGKKKLAGIYYNYHLVNASSDNGLEKLDKFLKAAILSSNGAVFSNFQRRLTSNLHRQSLLKISFSAGFKNKTFLHFPPTSLEQIQKCWRYA
ncbi:antiviral reverse transcriptase Drt3a [Undibacterium sp. TC9W]|uniref:antiviral reverse transcriptase Drt3a n=1 Tax=Undibacterium sp. TC9W TaxID=3413053 RepID=UPI003BF3B2B3